MSDETMAGFPEGRQMGKTKTGSKRQAKSLNFLRDALGSAVGRLVRQLARLALAESWLSHRMME